MLVFCVRSILREVAEEEQVVTMFRDGRFVKGMAKDFRVNADMLVPNEETTLQEREVAVERGLRHPSDTSAPCSRVFFVRSTP